jgi:hypothetical protein
MGGGKTGVTGRIKHNGRDEEHRYGKCEARGNKREQEKFSFAKQDGKGRLQ